MKVRSTKIPLRLMLLALLTMVVALFSMADDVKASGGAASPAKVYVDPSGYTAKSSSDIFTVEVKIENALNLGGFEFKLKYDTTILNALEVVEGPFLGSFGRTLPAKLEKNETFGFVWVAIALFEPTQAEGTGTLATVSFKCADTGECIFDLYDTKLVDAEALYIDHYVTDGYSADEFVDPPSVHITDTMDAGWIMNSWKGLDGYVDFGYSADTITSAPTSILAHVWGWGTRGQDMGGININKTFSWEPAMALVRLKLNYLIDEMTDGDAWGGMAVLTSIKVITHDAAGKHEYSYIVAGATTDVYGDWSYYMCQDYGPNVKYINWNNEEIPAPGHGELEPPADIWYTLDRNVNTDFDIDWSNVTEIEIMLEHGGGYLHEDHFKVYFDDLELEGGPWIPPPPPPPSACPCDVNFDWIVDLADYYCVAEHFGQCGPSGWIPEDVNKDGFIDIVDIFMVARCIFKDPTIKINQTGVGSDFTGTVVIINSINYGVDDLPYSFHLCKTNYTFTFAFQSLLAVAQEAKQYNWTSTSGLSTLQGETITVSNSGNIIGNYNAQYYLKVVSLYDISGGQGWYDAGETAYATLQVGLEYTDGLPYGFVGWSGDATGLDLLSDPIIMNAPKTAIANWEASKVYGDVRTVGFWKHQVNAWYFTELRNTGMKIRGIGTSQISEDILITYLKFVDSNSDYFKGKIVEDNNGDGTVADLEILENAYNILETPRGTDSIKMRAEQQLLSLWLNLAHEAFFWNTQLSQEDPYIYCQYNYEGNLGLTTIGESIKWAEAKISSPDGNCEAVKDVCNSINNSLGIIWGT